MKQKQKGFTLLEILLVVAAISILAGIVIIAINPTKQLGDTRNAQRRADVNTILSAIYQYALDNNGNIPTMVEGTCTNDVATKEVCKAAKTGTCLTGTDLTGLTSQSKYLVALPIDPSGATADGTGYYVTRDTNNRVTVCAPSAEGASISATR